MYLLATLLRGKDFDLSTEGKSFLAMWGNVSRKLLMGDSWYSQAITSGSLFLNLALGKNEDSNVCYRGGGGAAQPLWEAACAARNHRLSKAVFRHPVPLTFPHMVCF